jgi:hypothetical protein
MQILFIEATFRMVFIIYIHIHSQTYTFIRTLVQMNVKKQSENMPGTEVIFFRALRMPDLKSYFFNLLVDLSYILL